MSAVIVDETTTNGNIYLESPDSSLNTGIIKGVNDVVLKADNVNSDIIINDLISSTKGNITLEANRNITSDLDLAIQAQNNVNLTATTGSIGSSVSPLNLTSNGIVSATAGQSVNVNSVNNDITFGNVNAGTNIVLTSKGDDKGKITITQDLITDNGYITVDSAKDLALSNNVSASQAVTINAHGGINQSAGTISSTDFGNVAITNNDSGDLSVGSVHTADGNVILNNSSSADGKVILKDNILAGKNTEGSGNIIIDADGNIEQFAGKLLDAQGGISLSTNNGDIGSAGNKIAINANEAVNAKINNEASSNGNIYLDSPNKNLLLGEINGYRNIDISTSGTGNIETSETISGNSIILTSADAMVIGSDLTSNNTVLTAANGIAQTENSVVSVRDAGNLTINNTLTGDIALGGLIQSQTGDITITNNASGDGAISLNNVNSNGNLNVDNYGNGLINLNGTLNANGPSTVINAHSTGDNSGITANGIINNTGSLQIKNSGAAGTQLGGLVNNNLVDETTGKHSDITIDNNGGSVILNGTILNGKTTASENKFTVNNAGDGGINFTADGIIDNHGKVLLNNKNGTIGLYGTLKARLKSDFQMVTEGSASNPDNDVILGLKLENWGNEMTFENTGAGSLIVTSDAVLSNFSVKEGNEVYTGILNLKNSGDINNPLGGGGLVIDGTINNGLVSDGTLVGNDGNIIAAGDIASGGIINIENTGTGVRVDSETIPDQTRDDFGINITENAKINNYAEMNIVNKNNANGSSLGQIKISGNISGDKGAILNNGSGVPVPSGNIINIKNEAVSASSGIHITADATSNAKGNTINITNVGQKGVNIDGVIHGENINIDTSDSNVNIAHNNTIGNVIADKNIKITTHNGSILNHTDTAGIVPIDNAVGLNAGENMELITEGGNIGVMDSTLGSIKNDGFVLNPNNAVNVNVGGSLTAKTPDHINIKAVNKDMNIDTITTKDALISSSNAAITGGTVNTSNNLYLYAKGEKGQINIDNVLVGNKLISESDGNTTIGSSGGLYIDSMMSNKGSINVHAHNNT